MVAAAVVTSAVVGAAGSAYAGKKASEASAEASQAQAESTEKATDAQLESTKLSLEENRRQFDKQMELFDLQQEKLDKRQTLYDERYDRTQQLLQPFIDVGTSALEGEKNLLGLAGEEAQQQEIEALKQSPLYQNLISEGEEAILANASATGGLRGGNVQRSLSQYRPQVLQSLIDRQLSAYSGLSGKAQNAVLNQGTLPQTYAGDTTAGRISAIQGSSNMTQQLLQNQGNILGSQYNTLGQIQAGNALAQGQAAANTATGISNAASSGLNTYLTLSALKVI